MYTNLVLKNKTLGLVLNTELIHLRGFKDKTLGAIFFGKKNILYLETRFGIHTFFVNFPLDLIILDKNNRVKKIKENLGPNRIFLWNPKYFKVFELPAGSIKALKLNVGSILEFNL